MSEPQPEYVWVFPPERRRNTGRIWLIIGLSVAAIAIAAVAVWFFFRPQGATTEPSPSPTTSVSASPTPSPTAGPTATPTPRRTNAPTPPPPTDPSLDTFRENVAPVLDSASTGLRYAREDGGQSAVHDVALLQEDANRLSERIAPASIASDWATALASYSRSLESLRGAYELGGSATAENAAAVDALADLNDIIGR